MGWTRLGLNKPVKDWFIESINKEYYEVVDFALVKFKHMYAAIKDKKNGNVFCLTYLINWYPNDFYNFAYKDMDEFCGPGMYDCPERILKILTPLNDETDPNGWARNWRKKNQEHIDKNKMMRGNMIIKVNIPVLLTNGMEVSYFKKEGRCLYGGIYNNENFMCLCRTRNFKLDKYNPEVVKKF